MSVAARCRSLSHPLFAALLAGAILLAAQSADAALTTGKCLGQKRQAWTNLRKCQGTAQTNQLTGKPDALATCQPKLDKALASLSKQATAAGIACRYGVNGDGTLTDYDTGLTWEHKTGDGTVHDRDNRYTWSQDGFAPDGTVFSVFLTSLNDCTSADGTTLTGGFAGHCDWRLPTIVELATLRDLNAPGCHEPGGACIDQTVFGPTLSNYNTWSAITGGFYNGHAWTVNFFYGDLSLYEKIEQNPARAVRSAW